VFAEDLDALHFNTGKIGMER